MQAPCSDFAAQEECCQAEAGCPVEDNCTEENCDNETKSCSTTEGGSCCVYTVISYEEIPTLAIPHPEYLAVKNTFQNFTLPPGSSNDFWQPPRPA